MIDQAASELQVIIFGRKGGESRRRDDSLLEDKKVPRSPNKQKILEKKSETIPMGGGLASNKAREKMCSVEVKLPPSMSRSGLSTPSLLHLQWLFVEIAAGSNKPNRFMGVYSASQE
ncbi:hypothetical protein YC2023_016646 [Brassica napus]